MGVSSVAEDEGGGARKDVTEMIGGKRFSRVRG